MRIFFLGDKTDVSFYAFGTAMEKSLSLLDRFLSGVLMHRFTGRCRPHTTQHITLTITLTLTLSLNSLSYHAFCAENYAVRNRT